LGNTPVIVSQTRYKQQATASHDRERRKPLQFMLGERNQPLQVILGALILIINQDEQFERLSPFYILQGISP